MSSSKKHNVISAATGGVPVRHDVEKPTSGAQLAGSAKASPKFKDIPEKTDASKEEEENAIAENMKEPSEADKKSYVNDDDDE